MSLREYAVLESPWADKHVPADLRIRLCELSEVAFQHTGDPMDKALARMNRGIALANKGMGREANAVCAAALRVIETHPDRRSFGRIALKCAEVLLLCNPQDDNYESCFKVAASAASIGESVEDWSLRAESLVMMGRVCLQRALDTADAADRSQYLQEARQFLLGSVQEYKKHSVQDAARAGHIGHYLGVVECLRGSATGDRLVIESGIKNLIIAEGVFAPDALNDADRFARILYYLAIAHRWLGDAANSSAYAARAQEAIRLIGPHDAEIDDIRKQLDNWNRQTDAS